jgi:alpha-beta hydrolase superfamily lysophospholipase
VPFHINHGSDDYGVPFTGSQRLFQHSKTPPSDKELNIVPDGYHGLLSQIDAEDTMRREIEWIEKRIEANK